ncbi:MAG: hypothetical protein HOO04_05455 [Phycisphaerae bacterium]|jgi:hypothetical protein|nr:hypothetical protein [Phycisphaerae bacterium]MBT5381494.1 hypothetical protein [Phycisphaerae bacterium]MBT5582628.1 hypothetical protein [Phycisphaerae bacterium]MBT5656268.1 hypothetical protein [Phycisphaerae bacterium]
MTLRVIVLLYLVVCASGCESLMGPSSQPAERPKPSLRPKPKTVALRRAATADRLIIMVGANPRDTDADGYPDMLDINAMLFEGRAGEPVLVDGSFDFELEPLDESIERPWRTWHIDAAKAAGGAGPTLFDLPGYALTLDLRQNGGDGMAPIAANLTGTFTPLNGGRTITCVPGQRVVQLGAQRRN